LKSLKNKASKQPIQNATQLLNTLSVCFDQGAKDEFFKAWKQLLKPAE